MKKMKYRVRIVHTGKEFTMSLSPNTQGTQIVKALLNNTKLNLEKTDCGGNLIEYKLTSNHIGKDICNETLANVGVTSDDLLLLFQRFKKMKYRVRIVHIGKEFTMSLSPNTQGTQIVKASLNNTKLNLAKTDCDGELIEYELTLKRTGKNIRNETLANIGVTSVDLLLLSQKIIAGKPIIYLYPNIEQEVSIKLNIKGIITVTYPPYKDEWKVKAFPDGKIINFSDNKEYSYLFWEANIFLKWNIEDIDGFVVKGGETAVFLQDILSKLGLLPKEYNEFIVWWLPQMQNNKYNFIHFSEKEYQDIAQLSINPKPDSVLRIFMVWKALETKIKVKEQKTKNFKRKGFTVVEWGGTQIY